MSNGEGLLREVKQILSEITPFMAAIPLLFLLFIVGLIVLFQVQLTSIEQGAQAQIIDEQLINDPGYGLFCLQVIHPNQLLIEDIAESARIITVHLLPATRCSTLASNQANLSSTSLADPTNPSAITSTPTMTLVSNVVGIFDTSTITATLPTVSVATEPASVTPCTLVTSPITKTLPLTTANFITYVVSLNVGPDLAPADILNKPIFPDLLFRPSLHPIGENIWSLRQRGTSYWSITEPCLKLNISHYTGKTVSVARPVPIKVETLFGAIGRKLRQSVIDHGMTVWLAFLPLYAALLPGWIERHREQQKQVKKQREAAIQAAFQEIDTLCEQRNKSSVRFLQQLETLEARILEKNNATGAVDTIWQSHDVRNYLERIKGQTIEKEFAIFYQLQQTDDNGREKLIRKVGASDVMYALNWVYLDSNLDQEHKDQVPVIFGDLRRLLAEFREFAQQFDRQLRFLYWNSFLEAWPLLAHRHKPPLVAKTRKHPAEAMVNPFVNWRAETDLFLFDTDPLPQWLQHVAVERTLVIYGASGLGKTAAALEIVYLLLTNEFRLPKHKIRTITGNPQSQFPVYWSLDWTKSSHTHYLHSLTSIFAKTLISHLCVRPEDFLASDIQHQVAMADLLALSFGTSKELEFAFLRQQRRATKNMSKLFTVLHTLHQGINYRLLRLSSTSDERLYQTLAYAYPSWLEEVLLLVDLHLPRDQVTLSLLALGPLLMVLNTLNDIGLGVKLFLPEFPPELTMEWPGKLQPIDWHSKELLQLLENRLKQIEPMGAMSSLCDSRDVTVEAILMTMVKECNGSPRKLMEIGNRIFESFANKGSLLMWDDLRKIFTADITHLKRTSV